MSAAFFDPTMYASSVQQAQHMAAAAHHALMQPPEAPRNFIQSCWSELIQRNHAAATGGPDAQLAAANEALAVMTAIGRLPAHHYRALNPVENSRAAEMSGRPVDAAKALYAAVASSPVLAKFQAERDQAHQERAAAAEAKRQAIEAQQLRDAPRNLLVELRSRGLALGLSADGKHITATREHLAAMQQTEVATVKERVGDFLKLLKAEAAAAAPIVIA